MKKQLCRAGALSALLFVSTWSANVSADVIITAIESGNDVILSSDGGTLDLTGLTFVSTSAKTANAIIDPDSPLVSVGSGVLDRYDGVSGPANFGSGNILRADLNTGNLFGISTFNGPLWVVLPTGFVTGGTLGAASGTWLNESFASLGMMPGTYVWSWANDSITLRVADGDLAPLGNPDGNINSGDVLIALRIALGIYTPGALELGHGDMNADGVINLSDVIMITNKVMNQ